MKIMRRLCIVLGALFLLIIMAVGIVAVAKWLGVSGEGFLIVFLGIFILVGASVLIEGPAQ